MDEEQSWQYPFSQEAAQCLEWFQKCSYSKYGKKHVEYNFGVRKNTAYQFLNEENHGSLWSDQ